MCPTLCEPYYHVEKINIILLIFKGKLPNFVSGSSDLMCVVVLVLYAVSYHDRLISCVSLLQFLACWDSIIQTFVAPVAI